MKLFIFGSTGDLVRRKVLPALQSLKKEDLEIIAIGRKELDKNDYCNFACDDKCDDNFKKSIHYIKTDFNDGNFCSVCSDFLDKDKTNYFYLSIPPKFFNELLVFLSQLKKKGIKVKILIEKPFGENLEYAKQLEKLIKNGDIEDDVFLSDHYLFKKNIINLEKRNFKELKITVIEKLGLEGRTSYYDDVGALKDMVQSHFFNILFKLLDNPNEIKSAKIINYTRAQYGNGVDEGYVKELGKKSRTETFVFLKLKLEEKEITFITGKAFDKKFSELKIDEDSYSLDEGEPYKLIISDFLSGNKTRFPTISNAILSWEIIEKISSNNPKLLYYKQGTSLSEVMNQITNI